jgi:hypothetical protein
MRTQLPFAVLAAALFCSLVPAPAQAQRARVFVSVNGVDGNPCTAGSPCRTFQFAHDTVAAGGEIDVLDTGGYGRLEITKAISIVNPTGVAASIAVASGETAINVVAGPSDVISLRGLTLDGNGVGDTGVFFNAGGGLEMADCVVRGYIAGVAFEPGNPGTLALSNVSVSNTRYGITISPFSDNKTLSVTLNRVEVRNNSIAGLEINSNNQTGGKIDVRVVDSILTDNTQWGVDIVTSAVTDPRIDVFFLRSVAAKNGIGVNTSGPQSTVRLAESQLTSNAQGYGAGNGSGVLSYGNNFIDNNGIVNFAPPGIPMK